MRKADIGQVCEIFSPYCHMPSEILIFTEVAVKSNMPQLLFYLLRELYAYVIEQSEYKQLYGLCRRAGVGLALAAVNFSIFIKHAILGADVHVAAI